jgi:aryl-alcohol dehydrogenase-like predicted oxidoreductase
MAELVAAGKVRAIGMSEVDAAQLREAHAIHPVATVQSELSLWTRDALAEVLPWCTANGAGLHPVLAARARLSHRHDAHGAGRRLPQRLATLHGRGAAGEPGDRRAGEVSRRVAGATPAQVALAWCLAQGERVVPIPGTRRLERLQENAGAANLTLDDDSRARLDALPMPVGGRY